MARVERPYEADERTMLLAFLDFQRESVVMKLDGLSEEQARWTPAPTANSLIGLVNHLARVEEGWFQRAFLGERPPYPGWADPKADPDWDFNPPDDQTIAQTIALYREKWDRSNEIARAAPSLDKHAAHPKRADITLRWILNHMVEETARHAGHADITRELIDGSTGI